MLVVPVIGKISWRNPPIVTLALIAVNIVVFILSLYSGLGEVIMNYGFRPSAHEPVTFLTYMFLHGGFPHILGNMVFLWLVGCMLEMGSGRLFLIICYFLTGLGSAGLFCVVYSSSEIPLVGASGAISGLMGAMAVMFGGTKIKVFYSLGFYFDYVKFPAIVLLPLWIGNELFQLYLTPESHIAYVAHLGGLISGTLIALASLVVFKNIDHSVMEEQRDEVTPLVEAALKHLEMLELKEGRELLMRALEMRPQDTAILVRIFNIDQHDSDNPRFHDTAERLLSLLYGDPTKKNQLFQIYLQYSRLSPEPRLPLGLYGRLCSAFINMDQVETAEEILEMLIRKSPELHFLPSLCYSMAQQHYNKKRMEEKRNRWNRLIYESYPDSREAAAVRKNAAE